VSDPTQEVCADKAIAALGAIREACQRHGIHPDHTDNVVRLYCAERMAIAAEQISDATLAK
jgi:hypothetical protein